MAAEPGHSSHATATLDHLSQNSGPTGGDSQEQGNSLDLGKLLEEATTLNSPPCIQGSPLTLQALTQTSQAKPTSSYTLTISDILGNTLEHMFQRIIQEFKHKSDELDHSSLLNSLQGHPLGLETKFLSIYSGIKISKDVNAILLARLQQAHSSIKDDIENLIQVNKSKVSELERDLPNQLFIAVIQELLSSAYMSKITSTHSSFTYGDVNVIRLRLKEDMPDSEQDSKLIKDLYEWANKYIKGEKTQWPGNENTGLKLLQIIKHHQVVPTQYNHDSSKRIFSWFTKNQITGVETLLPFNKNMVVIYIALTLMTLDKTDTHPATKALISLNSLIFPDQSVDSDIQYLWIDAVSLIQRKLLKLQLCTFIETFKRPVSKSKTTSCYTTHYIDPRSIDFIHSECNNYWKVKMLERKKTLQDQLTRTPTRSEDKIQQETNISGTITTNNSPVRNKKRKQNTDLSSN
jgi:hypothetical protein